MEAAAVTQEDYFELCVIATSRSVGDLSGLLLKLAPSLTRCPECGLNRFDHVDGCKLGERCLTESYRRSP